MRKSLITASVLAVTVAVAPACASKKFVRSEVGNVNDKVDTLSGTLEETQERTRLNEERIGQVDQKAEAAGQSAQAAAQTAQAAGRSATDARSAADGALARANAVGSEVTVVNTRVEGVEVAHRRLVFEVTLSEDQGNFTFGRSDLPDEAKARLDEVITDLKGDPKGNMFIEIEGHTDNVGAKEFNAKLGMERAEAVKRYLYEEHQIPLHKMNVISYGEDKPMEPNNTRDGRAKNRRVVVKVLL
jgi:outer membrane protein OmpA-like peptidoglycan-associated protein